ncbi:MAG: Hsp20/alpha crystallin family protein [Chloroflexota bacterium]|nr:Hsp20/alpha crystallin family protein [Chloroflexota bacterium]
MASAVASRKQEAVAENNTAQDVQNNNTNLQTQQHTGQLEQTGKQELQATNGAERTRSGRVYTPAVDIYETNEAIVLVADMPGVDESSVDVTLEKNVLTIYGRVQPWQFEGHTLRYAEYGIGDYQRSFTISNQIDWEHIQGSVSNGVLRLTLPKTGPAQTRKIEIKGA